MTKFRSKEISEKSGFEIKGCPLAEEPEIDIVFEKAKFAFGLTILIWSFMLALTTGAAFGFILFLAPPISAYLIINSLVNILEEIQKGKY